MKLRVELPEDLVAAIEGAAEQEGRKVEELIPELVSAGLMVRRPPPRRFDRTAAARWLTDWVRLGQEATRDLPPGPTAAEILAADRGRLSES